MKHCPLCDPDEKYGNDHAGDCPESVPSRVGYFRGIPVVADLQCAQDGMDLLKSNPLFEPNCWHATIAAVERLRKAGQLVEPS